MPLLRLFDNNYNAFVFWSANVWLGVLTMVTGAPNSLNIYSYWFAKISMMSKRPNLPKLLAFIRLRNGTCWLTLFQHIQDYKNLSYTWYGATICSWNLEWRNTLHWHHNNHDGVSNHQPHGCLLKRLFRRRSKKTSKLRVTGLCGGNSPGPVNSPHKGPDTRKMFPFDDVIMTILFAVETKLFGASVVWGKQPTFGALCMVSVILKWECIFNFNLVLNLQVSINKKYCDKLGKVIL